MLINGDMIPHCYHIQSRMLRIHLKATRPVAYMVGLVSCLGIRLSLSMADAFPQF